MAPTFDITPEKEGSFGQFLYRQFFKKPSRVSRDHAYLQGKTAIVTGSNGGMGLECSRQLRDFGLTKLIIAVRDEDKGRSAAATLSGDGATMSIEVWKLDLASYDSIIQFTERANALERVDIVVLNAGITGQFFRLNPTTGHEQNIQINYLSMALLAIKLLPVLKSKRSAQQGPSRLVIVSSDAAAWTSFPEQSSDPLLPAFDHPGKINMVNRYYTSKLLQQFFLLELAGRVSPAVAIIVATTPGLVYGTETLRDTKGTARGFINEIAKRIIGYSPEVGARQLTDAVVNHGSDIHGQYLCSQKPKPWVFPNLLLMGTSS